MLLPFEPLYLLLLVAFLSACFGALGGLGGRALAMRALRSHVHGVVEELWDAVEGISSRLSRREGRVGAETRKAKDAAAEAEAAALAEQFRRGAPPLRPRAVPTERPTSQEVDAVFPQRRAQGEE